MPRPTKCRRVEFVPGATYFKPAGIPLRFLAEIQLSLDEAEAIRLKEMEGLEQQEGAERMNVSRATFQRILASARHKLADALLNGKAIRVQGGHFEMIGRRFRCRLGHQWNAIPTGADPTVCPTCSTSDIMPVLSCETATEQRGRQL